MTEREAAVLGYLVKKGGSAGPTEIGLALGFDNYNASSAVTGALKHLVRLGLVERIDLGKRNVSYKATK